MHMDVNINVGGMSVLWIGNRSIDIVLTSGTRPSSPPAITLPPSTSAVPFLMGRSHGTGCQNQQTALAALRYM